MSRASEMKFDDLAPEFRRGVTAYFAGEVPEGWDGPTGRFDPFLAGWNIAAEAENGQGAFFEGDDDDEDEEDED